jgi:hypothetical protein
MLIPVYINGTLYYFQNQISILDACRSIGIKIPRFCYHENLSIAGNCRMCLVEIHEILKPIVACSTEISANLIVYTESPFILKARENILEFLLLNHPLDCPICDQAGECDLQDQAIFFGSNFGRNYFNKRGVEDKNLNHLIKTIMTRCIHCTKCVRFGEEICGVKFFGTLNRGTNTEIGNYLVKLSLSDMSANVVDLCPVGALTLKTIPFQIRPWEIQIIESIDLSDAIGSNIYLTYKGLDLCRVLPKKNKFINEAWLSNKARFYYELMVKPNPQQNLFFPSLKQSKILYLLNPDLDLNTLFILKKSMTNYSNVYSRLLNSTCLKTNLFFLNTKLRIISINKHAMSVFFLLNTNLEVENSILNIRIKSKIKQSSTVVSFGSFYVSTFPVKFVRFLIKDFIDLIKGTHFFYSKKFLVLESIIFANKMLYDRLDSSLIKLLTLKNLKFYSLSNFCNSEGSNILNFKKFNYKELKIATHIFGLGLDDTYLIRKFIFLFKNFYWVNKFSSNILSFLPRNAWINLEINQLPGFYVNFEQRIQKFELHQTSYNLTMQKIIALISSFLTLKPLKRSKLLKYFQFHSSFWVFADLKECVQQIIFFDNTILKFSFFLCLINTPTFHLFKNLPLKSIIEDPYRTSLQLKYSRSLTKSSQLLRADEVLFR